MYTIFSTVLRQQRESDVMACFGHSDHSAVYQAGFPLRQGGFISKQRLKILSPEAQPWVIMRLGVILKYGVSKVCLKEVELGKGTIFTARMNRLKGGLQSGVTTLQDS
jgi:hypothetical protein